MARIALHIQDPANRLTLKALLEAVGHQTVEIEPEVCMADNAEQAVGLSGACPTLLLCPVAEVSAAVAAMERGVFDYVLLPLQPGEAPVKVARALQCKGVRQGAPPADAPPRPLAEVEAEHILDTLRRCRYNRSEAARALGIGRNTLWRKLKALEELGYGEAVSD